MRFCRKQLELVLLVPQSHPMLGLQHSNELFSSDDPGHAIVLNIPQCKYCIYIPSKIFKTVLLRDLFHHAELFQVVIDILWAEVQCFVICSQEDLAPTLIQLGG